MSRRWYGCGLRKLYRSAGSTAACLRGEGFAALCSTRCGSSLSRFEKQDADRFVHEPRLRACRSRITAGLAQEAHSPARRLRRKAQNEARRQRITTKSGMRQHSVEMGRAQRHPSASSRKCACGQHSSKSLLRQRCHAIRRDGFIRCSSTHLQRSCPTRAFSGCREWRSPTRRGSPTAGTLDDASSPDLAERATASEPSGILRGMTETRPLPYTHGKGRTTPGGRTSPREA